MSNATTTLVVLPQTIFNFTASAPYNVTGNAVAAGSYYLGCKHLQTLNVVTTNLIGNIRIEASLASQPGNAYSSPDWFQVYEVIANNNAATGTPEQLSANTNVGVNINGNFVWMRAKIENLAGGQVNWVKLSY